MLQELLGASRVVAAGSLGKGAKAAKDTVKDKVEDVQEAWETSQVCQRSGKKLKSPAGCDFFRNSQLRCRGVLKVVS